MNPELDSLAEFVGNSSINYRTDADGLPIIGDVMKGNTPTDFEKQYAMRLPLKPGAKLPRPQYRKMSHANLKTAAATIRAFAAQGWVYKCKSPTMAPIHMVHKEPKPGIDPKSRTCDCPEGKGYPPRWRMTIDMSLINPCFEIESSRIPDVKETIQSMRILAGESQRQHNAIKQGTRRSIHDPNPNASWNISSPPLPTPTDYQLSSCDLVHAFHQMFVHKSDQYLTAFGNNILGCWCWARGSQGTAGTPAAFYNFCHAALSKHGVLHSPDFDVSDLEKNDYLDFDTDEKGELF
eukprot:COSAG01_NODE_362_length_18130_cov_34.672307_15_plen_293_part_00